MLMKFLTYKGSLASLEETGQKARVQARQLLETRKD